MSVFLFRNYVKFVKVKVEYVRIIRHLRPLQRWLFVVVHCRDLVSLTLSLQAMFCLFEVTSALIYLLIWPWLSNFCLKFFLPSLVVEKLLKIV
jgi:hypothetical protein